MNKAATILLLAIYTFGNSGRLSAQSSANLLVIINEASPASIEIGSYYAQKRRVPPENIIRLRFDPSESIERVDYERQIEAPIGNWLTRNFAQDRILYIVLTKGIPLRINGTAGQDGTIASVDSELTLLYRKLTGVAAPAAGRINNPYFLGEGAPRTKPFAHENYDIFLVTRLDGYTVADARALVDRAATPSREGTIVLDDKASSPSDANAWLKAAAENLKPSENRNRVVYDTSTTVIRNTTNVLGYYSWGSNDPAIRERHFNLGFVSGALAAMFVSTDARTLNEPPSDWKIGTADDATTHFAGSPHSLMGDFIRDGVTGTAGHVAEPYLDATIRPNILFPAYLSGANLAEAFYQAMPYLSWQTVVIGDPLCAPFRSTSLSSDQIDKGFDASTELPQFYSTWRLKLLSSRAVNPDGVEQDVIKLLMRAEAEANKQDWAAVRQILEQATARDKRLGPANLNLGTLYEQAGEYDKAIERYRQVLALQPENLAALNNLAWALAVRKKTPAEGLPFAEKAYAVGGRNPNIVDTLAWIVHLMGNDRRATGLLAEAIQVAPQTASIRLHAAIVYAALGETEPAQQQLTRALELDPKIAGLEEVQQLRAKLKLP
jgi:uncharacterized protein (TIGR03790 family)